MRLLYHNRSSHGQWRSQEKRLPFLGQASIERAGKERQESILKRLPKGCVAFVEAAAGDGASEKPTAGTSAGMYCLKGVGVQGKDEVANGALKRDYASCVQASVILVVLSLETPRGSCFSGVSWFPVQLNVCIPPSLL